MFLLHAEVKFSAKKRVKEISVIDEHVDYD
jgi:hypothetical protein